MKNFNEYDRITNNNMFKIAIKSFLFSLLIFILSSFYLFLRRWDYNLYIANKSIATTALFLLGLSLVLGSFCYLFSFADKKLIYRKWLGITGFIFVIIHITISAFFIPRFQFPDWIFKHKTSFIFGTSAFILFLIMAILSNKYFENKLGENLWRKILRYSGNIGFLFIGIHLSVLKYGEWVKWSKTLDPILPPLSFFGIIFIVFIFILQIAAFISKKKETLYDLK